ncbi:MAG: hypothetical protein Fues2KO_14060 [Fuerstiella sp.]
MLLWILYLQQPFTLIRDRESSPAPFDVRPVVRQRVADTAHLLCGMGTLTDQLHVGLGSRRPTAPE